jgi:hypothetical protein
MIPAGQPNVRLVCVWRPMDFRDWITYFEDLLWKLFPITHSCWLFPLTSHIDPHTSPYSKLVHFYPENEHSRFLHNVSGYLQTTQCHSSQDSTLYTLRVLELCPLTVMLQRERDGVTVDWGKLHTEEHHSSYVTSSVKQNGAWRNTIWRCGLDLSGSACWPEAGSC